MRRHEHLLFEVFGTPGSADGRGETSDLTPLVSPWLYCPERLPLCEFRSIDSLQKFPVRPPES